MGTMPRTKSVVPQSHNLFQRRKYLHGKAASVAMQTLIRAIRTIKWQASM